MDRLEETLTLGFLKQCATELRNWFLRKETIEELFANGTDNAELTAEYEELVNNIDNRIRFFYELYNHNAHRLEN